jgi:hypothetical protein
MRFWIDIESLAGVKWGDGPIITAEYWEFVDRLDKAGSFSFQMPITDPRAGFAQNKWVAHCSGMLTTGYLQSTKADLGAGVIDQASIQMSIEGRRTLQVKGDNRLRELTWRNVGALAIGSPGSPATSGPADIAAFFPSGWSLDTSSGHNATLTGVVYTFAGESCLQALIKLAEMTGEHFRLGTGRSVVWMQADQDDSQIMAVQNADPIALEENQAICLILNLEEIRDSYDLVTRIYPYGSGDGASRVTLSGTTWSAPSGYTLDTVNNCIIATDAETALSLRIDSPAVSWKDINNSDTLAEAAYQWLKRRCSTYKSYKLEVDGLRSVLRPGQTIHVLYNHWIDDYQAVHIDADLVILETTNRADNGGVRTIGLTVATQDRWPASDETAIINALIQAQNNYQHDQS